MIKVLHKALNILEAVATSGDGMTLSEIAAAIDERTTTASNIVQVLYRRNYLDKLPGKNGYRLGSASRMISDIDTGQYGSSLIDAASDILTKLSADTESRSVLTVWRNGERHVMLRVEDVSPVTVNVNQPATNLYQNATGIMLLACRDSTTIRRYIEQNGLPTQLYMRVADAEEMISRLEWIRETGVYCRDRGEIFEAAAAVGLGGGTIDAAIGIFLPSFRAGDRTVLTARLQAAARELEAKFRTDSAAMQI